MGELLPLITHETYLSSSPTSPPPYTNVRMCKPSSLLVDLQNGLLAKTGEDRETG